MNDIGFMSMDSDCAGECVRGARVGAWMAQVIVIEGNPMRGIT